MVLDVFDRINKSPKEIFELWQSCNKFLTDEYSDEWKSQFGENLSKIGIQITESVYFQRQINKLDTLIKSISDGSITNIQSVKDFLNNTNMSKLVNFDLVEENIEKVSNLIKKTKVDQVNAYMLWTSVFSVIVISYEFCCIWEVWEELKSAKNIIEDSSQKLIAIRASVESIKDRFNNFKNFIITELQPDLSLEIKRHIIDMIKKRTAEIRAEMQPLYESIRDIRVQANSKIETLGKQKKEQKMKSAANALQVLVTGIQLIVSYKEATVFYGVFKAATVFGHGLMSYFNIKNTITCDEKINYLRQLLAEVEQSDGLINKLSRIILQFENILLDNAVVDLPDDLRRRLLQL